MMSGPDFSGFLEKASREMQITRAHHRESQLSQKLFAMQHSFICVSYNNIQKNSNATLYGYIN
jgi:hypothetical protein